MDDISFSDVEKLNLKLSQKENEITFLKNQLNKQYQYQTLWENIIKLSGKLNTYEDLISDVTDMLIGAFGLLGSAIYVERNGYELFKRENITGNDLVKIVITNPLKFKDTFKIQKNTLKSYIDSSVDYIYPIPLFNSTGDETIGYIVLFLYSKDDLSKEKQNFVKSFSTLFSIVLVNSYLYDDVTKLTNRDILTNAYNRRYLKFYLSEHRFDDHCTLVLFDLDNFKSVNDDYGHDYGDQLLIDLVNFTNSFLYNYEGILVRFGGDEFIMIFDESLQHTYEIVSEFKKKLLTQKFMTKYGVSASFGIESYPETVDNLDDLVTRADQSLYISKENGKDSITVGEVN